METCRIFRHWDFPPEADRLSFVIPLFGTRHSEFGTWFLACPEQSKGFFVIRHYPSSLPSVKQLFFTKKSRPPSFREGRD